MNRRPTKLVAGLVGLLGCSLGVTDEGSGCDPCPETDIVFEEVVEVAEHHLRLPVEAPLRLALGATVTLGVDGATRVTEFDAVPGGVVLTRLEGGLVLEGALVAETSLEVTDSCEREAALEVEVAPVASWDVSATATVESSPVLLPPEAVAGGVGLLPGGHVWLGATGSDARGGRLVGTQAVRWTAGLPTGLERAAGVRFAWTRELEPVEVGVEPSSAGVEVRAVPAGAAVELALADLRARRLVGGALEVAAEGGVVDLAAFARDAAGRLLRGFDDQGFAAELADSTVAAIGEPPDRTGPLFSVVGLEAGTTELRVTGHGRELRVPVKVVAP